MKKNLNINKGITLIALVITIIVLLILAGVSIAILTGENGILTQANKSKEENEIGEAKERAKLDIMAWRTDKLSKEEDATITNEQIQTILTGKEYVKIEEGNPGTESFVSKEGHTILYKDLYPVTEYKVNPGEIVEKTIKNNYKDEEGNTATIPEGFTVSKIPSEQKISTGLVIYEIPEDEIETVDWETKNEYEAYQVQALYNQFVWVPVPEISDLYDEENNAGQLWDFKEWNAETSSYQLLNPIRKKEYSENEYCEPNISTTQKVWNSETKSYDTIEGFDALPDNLNEANFLTTDMTNDFNNDGLVNADDFKIQLQTEFEKMIESVRKYDGFFIGRYETGDLSKSIAVVKQGNSDLKNQTWYKMYKLSNSLVNSKSAKTTMIWGCQWDATLRWFLTSEDESVIDYVEDSFYRSNPNSYNSVSGRASHYAANNIYDMSGSVFDWTMEVYNGVGTRIARGGYGGGDSMDVCERRSGMTSSVGCRTALYIAQ